MEYNPKEIERIFALAKQANAHSLRLWLFESSDFSMIHFNLSKEARKYKSLVTANFNTRHIRNLMFNPRNLTFCVACSV